MFFRADLSCPAPRARTADAYCRRIVCLVYVIIHALLQGGSSAAETFIHRRETPKIGFNHRTEVGYQIANADPEGSPTTSTYVKKKKSEGKE